MTSSFADQKASLHLAQGADAASYCASLVREHDFTRYASTLFAPLEKRPALLALYAFNVEIVRIPHLVRQPLTGEIRLQWWTDLLGGVDHGGVEGHPVAAQLLNAIRLHGLPATPLLRLIEAHQFDLYNDPMPNLNALERYLDETCTPLFTHAARVMGHQSDEIYLLAHYAALAGGLARVIGSLPFDAARRQLYIPLEILQRHGVDPEEVYARQTTPGLHAALKEIAAHAYAHLDQARALLAPVPDTVKRLGLALTLVARDLDRVSRPGFDPFSPVQSSRLQVLWALWRASRL